MYILLFVLIPLILVYAVISKMKGRREQKCSDVYTLPCPTDDEDKKVALHKSILGFCIFSSIFWILGLNLLFVGYKNIRDAREITEQGNKTIAEITDVHEYEVYEGDGNYSDKRDVYVTYTADGHNYDAIIKEANIYDSVGEQIEIYYSSENLTVIVSPKDIKNKVLLKIPLGVIVILLPFLMLIGGKIISKKQKSE